MKDGLPPSTKTININNDYHIIYGITGGHNSEEAAMQTDHLLGAIMDELEEHPMMATLIIGDLNAEPEDIPIMRQILEEESWTD